MKSISFDNPYLLLVFIPLVILTALPYLWVIKNGNRSKAPLISLILHLVISAIVTLALAGMTATTVMTKTEVFVLADVSYSSHSNLDVIDGYIDELEDKLPRNSEMGIVCFGKDSVVLTEPGGEIRSVSEATVDASSTDIAGALSFAQELFGEGVIKRIVLITDGKGTDNDAASQLINSIETLHANGIYIDAIFLDNNLSLDAREIQVSGVDFTSSTYLNHENTANVLLQSSYETQAIVRLEKNGETLLERAVSVTPGYNIVNFKLDTAAEGSFDYSVTVIATDDESALNNSYSFTQEVTGEVSILLITSSEADVDKARKLYGDKAEITVYVNRADVPTTVEELCQYDEIIISDVDVRGLDNVTSFIDALDKSVSLFGKSLVTMGDLSIQNKLDDDLKALEDMLPLKYGNNDTEPKLFTLVVDSSRSMQNASRLLMMKEAACELIDVIGSEDHVAIVSFSGDVTVLQAPIEASNKEALKKIINDIQPIQGTFLGKGLKVAFELMQNLSYDNKQVMLISDGMSYTLEEDNPVAIAQMMAKSGIFVSTINPRSSEGAQTLKNIAAAGGGKSYQIEDEEHIKDFIFGEVADDITETVINAISPVRIDVNSDPSVSSIPYISDVYGFVFAKKKASATTVLSVKYPEKDTYSPLYSWWNYGAGRVSSFTSSFSGNWTQGWTEGSFGSSFLEGLAEVNTPKKRVDFPFTLNLSYNGASCDVEIIPVTLRPNATVRVAITSPDGEVTEKTLTFDSRRYFHSFPTGTTGKYELEIVYEYDGELYTAQDVFNISYSPEYDSFAVFDSAQLFSAIRDRGTVSEGTVPTIKNDESRVATYEVSFALPFMIAAIALYIIDIIIRKLTWRDIVSFFGRNTKGEKTV